MEYQFNENGRPLNLGIIGLGGRGHGNCWLMSTMKDVVIKVVCDRHQDRVDSMIENLKDTVTYHVDGTTCAQDVFNRPDVEAVVIMTDWETHIDLAVQAMEHGKHVAMEVGGACSVHECWRLVRKSQQTGLQCMILENCCYGKNELTLLNMVRQGVLGELVHCQGGYEHDLRDEVGEGDVNRHYRQHNFMNRNGELYPTHELGPIMKYLDINYGNRMLYLTSMSSKAVGLHAWLKEHRADKPELVNATFNEGDIVTTLIKCARGETIVLTHDCTLPRPYSRGGRVQGTKGLWMEDNKSIYLEPADAKSDPENPYPEHHWKSQEDYREQYEHPLWKAFKASEKTGGHGGMDYLVMRAFIESVQNHTLPPIDVYDAAAWLSVTVLSEQSIALGSMPVAVPDFTSGMWMHREPDCTDQYQLDCEPAEE